MSGDEVGERMSVEDRVIEAVGLGGGGVGGMGAAGVVLHCGAESKARRRPSIVPHGVAPEVVERAA